MGEGEAFIPYLQRLAAERRGGILGGGMFGSMGEAEKKTADVNASDVLGDLIVKQTSGGSSGGGGGGGGGDGSSDTFYPSEGNNPYDRKTGRTYVPSLWGIDTVVDIFDTAAIRSELERSGYSDAEIDRILDNPEIAKALHSTGRIDSEYLSRPYDYNESGRNSNIFKTLGREFGITETPPANQYPLSPYYGGDGMFGLPVMVGSDVYNPADIANIRNAQRLGNEMTFNDINLPSLVTASERAVKGAEDARAREIATKRAAEEAARQAQLQRIQRQNEIDRQARAAQAARQAAVNASAGRSYIDSYAPSSVRSSGDSYTVSNSNTGYSANFSSSPSFGSGTFDTSGTFGD